MFLPESLFNNFYSSTKSNTWLKLEVEKILRVNVDRSGILKNDNANGGKPNFFYSAERGQLNSPGQESLPVCGQGLFCIVICYLQFCRVVK